MDHDSIKNNNNPNTNPFVVGVGSSAGGIEALINLVSELPKEINASLVIAQHLSPSHKSQMTEILARETTYDVSEIKNNIEVKNNHIYVGPPGFHIVYRDKRLFLVKSPEEVSPKPSVNVLFESLADELGDHAIGVVLSGTGSDGSRGLKAIKGVGGFAIVQNPTTAKYDGMPTSSLDTVDVDKVLAPQEIGREIATLTYKVSNTFFPSSEEEKIQLMEVLYDKIREETKIDFSFYKQSTLLRRVNRRLIATHKETLAEYVEYIHNNTDEVVALSKELLISVTNFFRDKEAFKALRAFVSDIVEGKKEDEVVRVWVAGCATGEEAYSIAILFLEEIDKQGKKVSLQLFGTDIDERALTIARKGCYSPHSVNSVDAELVEKYFHYSDEAYQPKKRLRDKITFSRQDITRDPPFLHLDMISFRNVLIYFNNELQQRVMSLFRYSLVDAGILFLGKSESIGLKDDFFAAVDRRCRIFKVNKSSKRPTIPKMLKGALTSERARSSAGSNYERLFSDAIIQHFGPSILINSRFSVLHSRGNLHPFISFPSGVPDLNLAKLITPEFAAELVSAMNKARRNGTQTLSRSRRIEKDNNNSWRLAVIPLEEQESDLFLVNFQPASDEPVPVRENEYDTENADVAELIAAREQLQTLTEEMAASAEEMQALNEEIQAANEELQANNEELEATNEELQATNEELISVNEESTNKSAELSSINSELESMYNTMDFPIFVFDIKLRLTRTNEAANRKYHLNTGTYKREVKELNLPEYFVDIEHRLTSTLNSGGKTNIIIKPSNRETYNIFITPIFNQKDDITGVILVIIDNSELVTAHERVEKSQEQLLAIMNNSLSVVALKDNAGRYEFVNARFEALFDVDANSILGKTDRHLFEESVAKSLREKDIDTMRSLVPIQTIDEFDTARGKVVLESVRFPIFDDEGNIRSICTQANDITRARHANEQLKLAGKLFDRAGEAILITDEEGVIVTSNQAFCEFTGYSINDIIGKTPRILSSGKHSESFYENMYLVLEQQGYWQGEVLNRHKSGHEIPMWLTINVVKDADGKHKNYVASYSDVNEIKNVQRKIEFLATHDELTKLPNRNVLTERLEIMIGNAQRQDTLCGVLFFDLDDFKAINDTLGHNIGDLLLKQVTKRLQKCIRDTDVLARMGGDEFVAVLCANEVVEIDEVAKRIIKMINAPFEINEHTLFVSASVGISIFPEDGEDNFVLLKNADTAMYRAKELGRNQYQYFTQQMKEDAVTKMDIEKGLRTALNENHFEIEFQPQIETVTGTIIGAEALLRCNQKGLKDIPAGTFIDIAEKGRLIGEVGLHAMELVFKYLREWLDKGLALPTISINVSTKQLRNKKFVTEVKDLLSQYRITPSQIKFEITESALMERIDKIAVLLDEFVELGIGLSVDDFGVGQSSLSYLRKLPIQEIKIDRSFIDGVVDEPDDRAIARTIIKMGQALGLRVVAEGIETEEQFNVLKEVECEIVQGFYFHKPLHQEAFYTLIKESNSKSNRS
ncbi:EAL domain-containing protein [Alteromonas pelagimontana]|uniref:EAL domain-containing protein n=1 Tax=Alteromonas pelagimontana TaxID=1858656 RepID=A0A6M4MCT4_9ALTE|nr:EAL domain-containing protein [Alteromonas pelagimontana]QJR80375.1 EAL domain-containing protein [Alteromonas pelagimontana]